MKKLSFVALVLVFSSCEGAFAQSFASTRIDNFWQANTGGSDSAIGTTYAAKSDDNVLSLTVEAINNGTARATDGTVGAYAFANLIDQDEKAPNYSYVETSAIALLIAEDFAVSGPGPNTVNGALNMVLHGNIDPNGGRVYARFGSNQLVLDVATGQAYYDPSDPNGYFSTHGITDIQVQNLPNGQENVTFKVPETFGVNSITPTSISIQALADAVKYPGQSLVNYEQTVNYMDTLGFNPNGPAVDLPEGYTVNSPTFHIYNNQVVPEPGGIALFASAGLLLFARRRR